MSDINIKKSRLTIIYLAILLAFVVIILRMTFIVAFGDKNKVSGIYDIRRSGIRSDIYDRNQVLLATDLKTKSLYVSSILVRNASKISKEIAQIFPDLSSKEIYKKIRASKNKQWILIRRNLTPSQVQKVQNLQRAGLVFEDDLVRVYPQKSVASHFVGYVDLDRKGLSGIEMQYNKQLLERDSLQLSLDIRIQDILHDELQNGLKEYSAKAASGIVMNVNNGEVLALVSLPDFDPNIQSQAKSNERFNRAVNGVYELGSVFKIFTNTIAFEENLVQKEDIFDVSDPIEYGRFLIRDDHKIKDKMTLEEVFANSSNIGTVKVAEKIGIKTQKEYLKKLGLLDKVETEFPGLGHPIFPKKWREINLYTIAYGHGIAVTPLHLATSVSAVVNGGVLYQPSFVKLDEKPKGKKIISYATSKRMRELLRSAVIDGTGGNADVEGYGVGGKTGTAERAEYGSYNKKQTLVSFVAAFPISKPKYLVYVMLDRPNFKFNTGGMVAAPVAGNVVRNIAPLLGVKPVN